MLFFMILLGVDAHAARQDLTWAGIDLGLLHLVGEVAVEEKPAKGKREALPARSWGEDFHSKAANNWNSRIQNLAVEHLDSKLRSRVTVQVGHLVNMHASLGAPKVETSLRTSDVPFLTRADVLVRVASYPRNPVGLSFTLIADQLNTVDRKGCYWKTFFDAGTGVVHETTYACSGLSKGRDPNEVWYGSARRSLTSIAERTPRYSGTHPAHGFRGGRSLSPQPRGRSLTR